MEYTCLYIAEFAAWALSRRWRNGSQPARPLVVCDAGRVFSCTPGLERRGLAIGDPVGRARSLVPEAEFHLRDVQVEKAIWDSLLGHLYEFTPQIEPLPDPRRAHRATGRHHADPRRAAGSANSRAGAGRSASGRRTPGSEPSGRSPADRGQSPTHIEASDGIWDNGVWALLCNADEDAIQQLCRQTGARIGMAPGRTWGMLAAAHSEMGRVTRVPDGMVMPFLRQARIDLLLRAGFSTEMVQRLHLFGLRAVAHILSLSQRQLSAQFGPEGGRLHTFLHPSQPEPPVGHYDPRVLSAAFDFEWPVFEPGQLQPVLGHLLGQLVQRLCGRAARHLQVRLVGRDRRRPRQAGRLLKDPAGGLQVLLQAAEGLLTQSLEQPTTPPGGVPVGRGVESLVVVFSGLTELPPVQASLFRNRASLRSLVKGMETRFPGKLVRPVQTHADPFFPEEEYRFEPVCP